MKSCIEFKKVIILCFYFCLTSFLHAQDSIISELVNKIEQFNKNFQNEKIYFTTDKEIYQPNDNIWFSAQIFNSVTNAQSDLSKGLKVKIIDKSGQIIEEEKFQIRQSIVSGNFRLPNKLSDGFYALIAYTTWMENDSLNRIFRKFIEIRNNISYDYDLGINIMDDYYTIDKPFKVEAVVYSPKKTPVSGAKVKVLVKADEKVVYKGDGKTDETGKLVFDITINNKLYRKPLLINCTSKYEGKENTTSSIIYPQPENIKLFFFPEGGSILTGFTKQIVIRATDEFGNPVVTEGEISDIKGQFKTQFKTNKNGFGYAIVAVREDSKLKATIFGPANSPKEYFLPEPLKTGTSLSLIKKVNDTLVVRMENSSTNDESDLYCLAYTGGKVFWAAKTKNTKAGIFKISVRDFPVGIVQIVIFNKNKELIAQRKTFINHKIKMSVDIRTEESIDSGNSKTKLSIKVIDNIGNPVKGNYTVSLTKKLGNLPANVNGINNYTYLFDNDLQTCSIDSLSEENSEIDFLLLASNSSSSQWINTQNNVAYTSKDGISGFVTDYDAKPITNAEVNLVDKSSFEINLVTSDSSGFFIFPKIEQSFGTKKYSITANKLNSNKLLNVILKDKFDEHLKQAAKNSVLSNYLKQNLPVGYYKFDNKGMLFDPMLQVKKDKDISEMRKMQRFNSSQSLLEIIALMKPYKLENNRIIFPSGNISINPTTGAVFVIDEVLMSDDVSVANSISTNDIKDIKILTDVVESARYTSFAPNGVIEITTRKGNDQKAGDKNTNDFFIKEFAANQTFNTKDIGTTLFWSPSIALNSEGNTLTIYIDTGIKGKYIGKVAGLTSDGLPFTGNFEYWLK